ncbi:MAG: hypothetical protein LBT37_05955 [Lactobacillaceae bacterium]|jgi:hypothetical protein|nr:hypothetical protein [Lactobacillaceae bacterium]
MNNDNEDKQKDMSSISTPEFTDETSDGNGYPLSSNGQAFNTTHPYLHYSVTKDKKTVLRKGFHSINTSELEQLNQFSDILKNTADYFQSNLANTTVHYIYKDEENLVDLPVTFKKGQFSHLSGVYFDGMSAEQTLSNIVDGNTKQNDILVHNFGATFQKLAVLENITDLSGTNNTILSDFENIKQPQNMNFQNALKNPNDMLIALRDIKDAFSIPVSILNTTNRSTYDSLPEKQILAVMQISESNPHFVKILAINDLYQISNLSELDMITNLVSDIQNKINPVPYANPVLERPFGTISNIINARRNGGNKMTQNENKLDSTVTAWQEMLSNRGNYYPWPHSHDDDEKHAIGDPSKNDLYFNDETFVEQSVYIDADGDRSNLRLSFMSVGEYDYEISDEIFVEDFEHFSPEADELAALITKHGGFSEESLNKLGIATAYDNIEPVKHEITPRTDILLDAATDEFYDYLNSSQVQRLPDGVEYILNKENNLIMSFNKDDNIDGFPKDITLTATEVDENNAKTAIDVSPIEFNRSSGRYDTTFVSFRGQENESKMDIKKLLTEIHEKRDLSDMTVAAKYLVPAMLDEYPLDFGNAEYGERSADSDGNMGIYVEGPNHSMVSVYDPDDYEPFILHQNVHPEEVAKGLKEALDSFSANETFNEIWSPEFAERNKFTPSEFLGALQNDEDVFTSISKRLTKEYPKIDQQIDNGPEINQNKELNI